MHLILAIKTEAMKLMKYNYLELSKQGSIAALVLRVTFGGFLLYGHGIGKVGRLFGDEPIKFLDFIGLGAPLSLALATGAEVIGSLMIMVGLFTRFASAPVIFTLCVAAFLVHGGDGFSGQEKLFLYIMGFVAILITGPGKYSIDGYLSKSR
ncbi:DoxX family protein [Fulvivirga lutimaris]|uniref:DoxX family protein n=1 Tax=Fulvivirga lutimaris TaxID=1819566 RepID=UPI0012BCB502|nr:DoxX family protein [Fulvivirga lutimaris]MTI39743.1 DoxX family protein [Fulvivirga lutimaris]